MSELLETTEEVILETTTTEKEVVTNEDVVDNTEKTNNEDVVVDEITNPVEKLEEKEEVELTDEQVLSYLNKKNVPVTKIEDLIAKIEPTEEYNRIKSLERDSLLLQKHLNSKVVVDKKLTIEQATKFFSDISNTTKEDPVKLGLEIEKEALIKRGYNKEDANEMVKNRYFQFTEEELSDMEEEDREAAIASKSHYENELSFKGNSIINEAKNYFSSLQSEIDTENLIKKADAEIDASILDKVSNLQKVLNFELKELDEKLGFKDIEVTLDEAAIKEVAESYQNKENRNKLFNKTDAENIAHLIELEATVKSIPKLIEQAILKGAKSQAEKLTQAMPTDAKQLFETSLKGSQQPFNKEEIHNNGSKKGSILVKAL